MLPTYLSPKQIKTFYKDGYIIVRNFCSKAEINKLYGTALHDNAMRNNALDLNDQSGKKTKLSLWFTPGNDVFGYLTRSKKMVHAMVNNALKTMELIYSEREAGDALFFHPNLLHRSEANLSEHPRWSIISCYSSQSNLVYSETSTSWHTPVDIVPDEAILKWDAKSLSEADFLKKENDPVLKETGLEQSVVVS